MISLNSILFESIPLPPRNVKLYFSTLIKRLRDLTTEVNQLYKERSFHFADEDVAYWMNNSLRYPTEHEINKYNIEHEINKFVQGSSKLASAIEDLWNSIQRYQKEFSRYDRAEYLGYILGNIKRTRYDYNNQLEFKNLRIIGSYSDKIAEFIKENEYTNDLDWFPEFLKTISNKIKQFDSILDDAESKIGRLETMLSVYREEDLIPKTEKVEQLYHTTVNADELFKTGFRKDFYDNPKEEGLGGSRNTSTGVGAVSFTSDLYVAKEIMRTLKEVIMIAKSKLKFADIQRIAGEEGILDEVMKLYKDLYGDIEDKSKDKYKRKLASIQHDDWIKDKKKYLKDSNNRDNPTNVMNLYRCFLSSSKRYDPLYFGNMEKLMGFLETKKEENVGILVCSIDMTNEDIDYQKAMEEWRVPVDAILSVDRVLK